MKIKRFGDIQYFLKVILITFPISLTLGNSLLNFRPAQLAEVPSNLRERDIHKNLGNDMAQDSILPSNPMEFMHMWRKSTAMDDATSPQDAIDQALKALDQEESTKIN
tara:strand:- start:704 stop:1027 length:324 start_codon:yes stop_codon:yes gene_type:complete